MLKALVQHSAVSLPRWCRLGFAICGFTAMMGASRTGNATPPLIPSQEGNTEAHLRENSPLEGGQGSVIHPFYVSVCAIDHNVKTKSLEITFKIFTEDLESALEDQTKERLRLGSKDESPRAELYIKNYLERNVTLQVNGDTIAFSFVGKEIEVDEAWCYVEVAHVPSVRKLTVRNSLLMEKFEAQQNLVHVKVGGKQKSLVLWKDKKEGTVEF